MLAHIDTENRKFDARGNCENARRKCPCSSLTHHTPAVQCADEPVLLVKVATGTFLCFLSFQRYLGFRV